MNHIFLDFSTILTSIALRQFKKFTKMNYKIYEEHREEPFFFNSQIRVAHYGLFESISGNGNSNERITEATINRNTLT